MNMTMIIRAIVNVTIVSCLICRALYTPTEGPPKYSAFMSGLDCMIASSSFSMVVIKGSFFPVLPILCFGVMKNNRVDMSCEKMWLSRIS